MVLCLSNNARYNLESVFPNTDAFNTSYAYDKNGNLDSLNRHMGGNLIDELAYQYANGSNQLLTVTDNGTTEGYTAGTGNYLYDPNGNMKNDPAKDSDIEYNYLNLPQKVSFANNDNLRYIYAADGAKLRKAIADELGNVSTYFDYVGPFIYENDTLKAIFTSAGRIVPMDDNGEVLYKFEYNLQDHLGNTRVVFGGNDNGRPELLQTTDYYPFGMVMNQQNYFADGVLANKYLYNGKELQDDDVAGVKLDWYDYGARFYDPALGRFHSVDPLAESMNSWSPYNYGFNNPIRFIDPDGMAPDGYQGLDGELAWFDDQQDDLIYKNDQIYFKVSEDKESFKVAESMQDAGIESASPGADNGTIKQHEPNLAEQASNKLNEPSNNLLESGAKMAGKLAYKIADEAFVTGTTFLEGRTNAKHLNNSGALPSEVLDAGVNSISGLVPLGKFGQMIGVGKKTLNAAQFSKMFKGDDILKQSHALRGSSIRIHNNAAGTKKYFGYHLFGTKTVINTVNKQNQ